jgi:hypothetical protein
MPEYRKSGDSTQASLITLKHILDTVPARLKEFSSSDFSKQPAPDKWSKKQIIGHLIDSATNNHHRFVRAQFEHQPTILYNQVEWNKHGYYDLMEDELLISFWEIYNRHLVELIKRIPPDLMERSCTLEDGTTRTIAWLFDDYVRHLEHHLKQIDPSFI